MTTHTVGAWVRHARTGRYWQVTLWLMACWRDPQLPAGDRFTTFYSLN
jgi:hypothetical protein